MAVTVKLLILHMVHLCPAPRHKACEAAKPSWLVGNVGLRGFDPLKKQKAISNLVKCCLVIASPEPVGLEVNWETQDSCHTVLLHFLFRSRQKHCSGSEFNWHQKSLVLSAANPHKNCWGGVESPVLFFPAKMETSMSAWDLRPHPVALSSSATFSESRGHTAVRPCTVWTISSSTTKPLGPGSKRN